MLNFTNIGGTRCTMYGYPGVALAGGTPVTQIGQAADQSTSSTRTLISLAPGAVAHAVLQIGHAGNYPSSSCDPVTATYLQVYPPGQTTPAYVSYTSPACAKPLHLLTVGALQPGAGSA